MSQLFLSDLHLAHPDSPQFRTLERVLESAAAELRHCWILGDLCEVWIGDDDDGPLADALTRLFTRCRARFQIHLMTGNRDFLFGPAFAERAGISLISDPFQRGDGVVLAHGDTWCVDDVPYQNLRATLRDPAWRSGILAQPLETRRALARTLREESRRASADKPANIMDVNGAAVAASMATLGGNMLVHGHTHRPAVVRESWGQRVVLGDWAHVAWMAWERLPRRFELCCLPLAPAGMGPAAE